VRNYFLPLGTAPDKYFIYFLCLYTSASDRRDADVLLESFRSAIAKKWEREYASFDSSEVRDTYTNASQFATLHRILEMNGPFRLQIDHTPVLLSSGK
jgi:hypothetical protein